MEALLIIRKLLETQANTVGGTFPTSFENLEFKPSENVPWQSYSLLPAQPSNPTQGADFRRELGVFQVMLAYPRNAGTQPAYTRAGLLRDGFRRGSSFAQENVNVRILRSPSVGQAINDGPWCKVPVSVPYEADVFN